MKRTFFILVWGMMLLVGCRDWFPPVDPRDPGGRNPDPKAAEFRNIEWKLVEIGNPDGSIYTVPSAVLATIQFDYESEVRGNNGCNSYGGEYSAGANNTIKFGPLLQTEMACYEPQNLVERNMMAALSSSMTYQASATDFWIYSKGGTSLHFNKVGPESDSRGSFTFRLDEPFKLQYGQIAQLENSFITVGFDKVIEDSRCPANVQCPWAGNAKVGIHIAGSGVMHYLELNTLLDPKQGSAMGHTVELMEVEPYPQDTNPIPHSDYTVLLRVTKD